MHPGAAQKHADSVRRWKQRASFRHQEPIDLAEDAYPLVLVAPSAGLAEESGDLLVPKDRIGGEQGWKEPCRIREVRRPAEVPGVRDLDRRAERLQRS